MAITVNGTSGITFPDSVLQPNGVPAPGTSGNVLTSNGTAWVSQTPSTSTGYGNIGTYVMAGATGGSTTAGSTYAGSTLVRQSSSPLGNGYGGYILVQRGVEQNLGLTGTWRCMTTSDVNGSYYGLDLFVRIS